MPERINVTDHHTSAVLLMNAIANAGTDFVKVLKSMKDSPEFEIELRINGHEVPVRQTLEHMWGQCDHHIKQEAGKLAIEMVQGASLADLVTEVRRHTYEIYERFKAAGFDFDPPDSY